MTPLLLALTLCAAQPAPDPGTLDVPRDPVVDRSGTGAEEELQAGRVGVVLPSWSRWPLYLAWRALALTPAQLEAANARARAAEEARRQVAREPDPQKAWEAASAAAADPRWGLHPGPVTTSRPFAADVAGEYDNCAPPAFALATRTLADLRRRPGVRPDDVRAWLTAQDQVFRFCGWVPWARPAEGAPPLPAPQVPAPLPRGASAYLRQLREYQVASAHFYAGEHEEALKRFDAMARTAGHPLRGPAAVSALRSVLRTATLSLVWDRAWAASRAPGVGEEERSVRLQAAGRQLRKVNEPALRKVEELAQAYLAMKDLAPAHDALRATLDQATGMLDEWRWFGQLTARLADLERADLEALEFRWDHLATVFLEGARPWDIGDWRRQHAYLDWMATLQACADHPRSPHARGRCGEEHAHALERWGRERSAAWLVAALATARRLEPADEPAVRAALETAGDAREALAVRYHALRLLVGAGRRGEALPLADAALRGELPEDARWLFRQQRLALATSVEDAGPFLLRTPARRQGVVLGADGDRLLNRTLGSEDLLELASAPGTPRPLAQELLLAAWFRADATGRQEVATEAATRVRAEVPAAAEDARLYLEAPEAYRHGLLVLSALRRDFGPQVGRHAGKRARAWWCSWGPLPDQALQIERTPPAPPLPVRPGSARELARLRELGAGPTYQAAQLLAAVKWLKLKKESAAGALQYAQALLDAGECPAPAAEAAQLRMLLRDAQAAYR